MAPSEEKSVKELLVDHMHQSDSFQKEMRDAMQTQNARITRQSSHLAKLNVILNGDEEKDKDGILQKMGKMNLVLCGDDDSHTEGVVQKVKKHGEYIAGDKKFKWTMLGLMGGGLGGVIGLIKNKLGEIF